MNAFYILIFLVAIILISIIALLVYELIKFIHWARLHKRKAGIVFIICIFVIAGFLLYRDYHKKYIAPYRFWNELLAKNPKPFLVSQKEFEEKNQQGYCWRDRKYYDKEELLAKAKASFIKLLQADAEELQNGNAWHSLNTDNFKYIDPHNPKDCQDNNGNCYVHLIPKEFNLSDFNKNNPHYSNLLSELDQYQYFSHKVSNKFIKLTLKNKKNYVIFPISYKYGIIYPTDCCQIIDKQIFDNIKNYYNLDKDSYYSSGFSTFMYPGLWHVPEENKFLKNGIGKYYFETKYIYIDLIKNNFSPKKSSIYLMNNCGDILHIPVYNPK